MKLSPDEFELRDIIVHGSRLLGLSLKHDAIQRLLRHLQLLSLWNKRINLTSLKDPSDLAVLHCLDSLTTMKVIPAQEGLVILDIGTGAGFPGLVIKNVSMETDLTLLDRHPGKIVFLKHVSEDLGLKGVTFLQSNINELLKSKKNFDLVVSRAFSSDPEFFDSLSFLVRPGGFLLRMAGPACLGSHFELRNFTVSALWEGYLPYSASFRKVILYCCKARPG